MSTSLKRLKEIADKEPKNPLFKRDLDKKIKVIESNKIVKK
jgi:hypothetical protein